MRLASLSLFPLLSSSLSRSRRRSRGAFVSVERLSSLFVNELIHRKARGGLFNNARHGEHVKSFSDLKRINWIWIEKWVWFNKLRVTESSRESKHKCVFTRVFTFEANRERFQSILKIHCFFTETLLRIFYRFFKFSSGDWLCFRSNATFYINMTTYIFARLRSKWSIF